MTNAEMKALDAIERLIKAGLDSAVAQKPDDAMHHIGNALQIIEGMRAVNDANISQYDLDPDGVLITKAELTGKYDIRKPGYHGRAPIFHLCAVCHIVPVDVENGYDTCPDCLKRQ